MADPTPWPAKPPEGAPRAVDLIADVLHDAFKGDTDIDLDMLAADTVDALQGKALTVELRWYDGDGDVRDEGVVVLGRVDEFSTEGASTRKGEGASFGPPFTRPVDGAPEVASSGAPPDAPAAGRDAWVWKCLCGPTALIYCRRCGVTRPPREVAAVWQLIERESGKVEGIDGNVIRGWLDGVVWSTLFGSTEGAPGA